jgi:hypothetical protein
MHKNSRIYTDVWTGLTLSRLFFPSIIFTAMRSVTERPSEARPFMLEPNIAFSYAGEFDPDIHMYYICMRMGAEKAVLH